MIDVTHWAAPQYALIVFLLVWVWMEQPKLLRAARQELKREAAEYPMIVYGSSALVSMIAPTTVFFITCWGGFFS